MIELFVRGGLFFMVPLLLASIAVVALTIERFIRFRRAEVDYDEFVDEMRTELRGGGVAAALTSSDETAGPVPRVWSEGLRAFRLPFPLIRERMEAAALEEVSRLERHIPHLSIIGQVAPLVGILGTVWGMINAFQVMEIGLNAGVGIQSQLLAQGIWKALITTAGGLLVAIPALLAHHYLQTRVDRHVEQLERSVADLVACLVPLRSRVPEKTAAVARGVSKPTKTQAAGSR